MIAEPAIEQACGIAARPAPPAGGARKRGRGCVIAGMALFNAAGARAQGLPSGLQVALQEVIVEEVSGQTVARFRFLAPAIARSGGTVRFADAEPDMARLCETVALPYVSENAIPARKVVISLADRQVEFGDADPDATQFFEAFRLENGACIWEGF